MSLTAQSWQEKAKTKLQQIQQWLHRGDAPHLVYGTVAGLALWPVVEAVAATPPGQLPGAIYLALGSLAGSIGSNLIAEQLQRWRDRTEPVTESEVAAWIAQETTHNTELRQAVDTLLTNVSAIPQAQAVMNETDRAWFTRVLQQAFSQLGNLPRFEAILLGKGAIAQGDGAKAVSGVLVEGDVGGNIITGNIYHGPPTQDPAEALRIYRQVLVRGSGQLPLRGVGIEASDPTSSHKPLGLANVYIDLDTTAQVKQKAKPEKSREADSRPLPALEAAALNRCLVLLGQPGSGKSTFVNHLAHCLAAHALYPTDNWTGHLPGWPPDETTRLPVVVILRDFAQQLPEKLPARAETHHLWDFLLRRLQAQRLEFVAAPLEQALEAGQALVLLDGLDEVASPARRIFVRDAVLAFVKRYHLQNRYLVTCRVLSYQPPPDKETPDLRLPSREFPTFELAAFDETKIDRFIAAWYQELGQLGSIPSQDVPAYTSRLRQAVRRSDLSRLAANPLLLTVMALVHTHKGRLPDARALLYEETVDMLLWNWEQVKLGGQANAPVLRQLLQQAHRGDVDLKKALWQLAYEAHAKTGHQAGPSGINESTLQRALARLASGNRTWAQEVIEAMKLRAGLLVEREPEVFAFPHRTFQEYLAGAHLASQGNFAEQTSRLAEQGALWRVVILLGVGRLVYLAGDTDKPFALVSRLCAGEKEDEKTWPKVWLAGEVLLEVGRQRVVEDAWGSQLLSKVQQLLAQLVAGGKLTPRERAEAGDTLAKLGDLRPGVCSLEPDLITIPAGTFLMGEDKTPILLETFQVARYPVTNAQFRFFVADGGYTEKWKKCWTKEGWQELQEGKWTRPRHWEDERFNQENQPVVGVSWYEAVAYCRWLSQQTGKPYRLPTEAEWERAARHTDGRIYPWGDEWQPGRANSKEAQIERPTAVGAFPAGAAPCGAQDMAGNVWEWCSTRWQDEKEKAYSMPYQPDDGREELSGSWQMGRVIRGGSFYVNKVDLRCAPRFWLNPFNGDVNYGLRVGLSPSTSGL